MKKRVNVVMLPTEKASNNYGKQLFIAHDKLYYGQPSIKDVIYYNLYFITTDEITKDCKWYIDDTNTVRRNVIHDEDYWTIRKDYKEILATTDEAITVEKYGQGLGYLKPSGIYLISRLFIEEFIALYNKKICIKDVYLEMEDYLTEELALAGSFINYRIKINDNNTVIVNEFTCQHE